MVRVIVCRPGETAAIEEIDDSLESMQRLVGGMIEEYQPFYDLQDPRVEDVAIFCNEEGKLNRLPPSRAIEDEDGYHVTGHNYEYKDDGTSGFYELVKERGIEQHMRDFAAAN